MGARTGHCRRHERGRCQVTCSPDRWSCPRCRRVVTRGVEHPDNWTQFLRDLQAIHGPDCAKKASVK